MRVCVVFLGVGWVGGRVGGYSRDVGVRMGRLELGITPEDGHRQDGKEVSSDSMFPFYIVITAPRLFLGGGPNGVY